MIKCDEIQNCKSRNARGNGKSHTQTLDRGSDLLCVSALCVVHTHFIYNVLIPQIHRTTTSISEEDLTNKVSATTNVWEMSEGKTIEVEHSAFLYPYQ
jgi:hypothetical protein